MKTEAPNDLSPKYNINFNLRGSLSRAMNRPLVVSMPRLVIFGDSSALYLAQVTDVTGSPYFRLSCIKAQSYIHGWAVQPRDWSGAVADDTVKLFVVDGLELSMWDLVEGKKLRARNLVADAGRTWSVFVEKDPAEPNTLVVLTDEERQRTTLQLFPPKPLRLTFDASSHTFQQEVTTLGTTSKLVVGPPAVGFNLARTIQTAWCVVSSDSVSARLRRLVTYDSRTNSVPWDKFVEANKAKYGPTSTGKTWQIDICPLPDAALPEVVLDGYALSTS